MTLSCDVAIVGGGIGGLTLATTLARGSISALVFEADDEMREIGAGVGIAGNATRLLERIGIDLATAACVPPDLELRRWSDGKLLFSHPIGDWYRQEVGAPLLNLHRATLQRVLVAAAPAGCIRLGSQLVDLSVGSEGVRLRFQDRDDVLARIVIGADGVFSRVRRYVCGEVRPVYSGEIGFRGVIPIERSAALPNPESLHIWCGPRTHVVYFGLDRGELVNLLAVYQPDRLPAWTDTTSRLSGTVEEALEIFADYGWDRRIIDLVGNIEGDMNFWALLELPLLPQWHRDRVVLMGDAAHAPLPHQGQGAAMAIEDAYTLGSMLAKSGLEDYRSAFRAFEQVRKRRTRRVQAYSRAAGRSYKVVEDKQAKRDGTWPSLPQRIGWIHRHHAEDALAQVV